MATLNSELLRSVVLFEEKSGRSYQSIATGFLLGFKGTRRNQYHTFLITNKHVVNNKNEVHVSLDSISGRRQRVPVPLIRSGVATWFKHRYAAVDIALLPVSMAVIQGMGADHKWIPEEQFLYFKDYEKIGFSLGDEVFFLGFPLGLAGKLKNTPLVRSGSLARADKEVLTNFKSVIIDGQNFPGNSGGPVFTKPYLGALDGTNPLEANHLIGLIRGYLPHTSHFVDPSTGQVAALTVENSGLALCVPIDYAKQIYNSWIKAGKPIII